MAKKMEEWERMKSSNRADVRGRSFENFRNLVNEEVDMANKIHTKRRLKELMEQKLEYFDRMASETHALLRRHAESKFKEIGEKEMALAKSVVPSRVREEAEERRKKEKDEEAAREKKKSKEKMTQEQFYGYPPWMLAMGYPRMPVPVTKSQGFASATEIDNKLRLLAQLEAARGVLQNIPIDSSASMAKEIRKRLKKTNRLQMKVIDDVLGYNPDLMSEIVSELMPTQSERNRFYGFGSDREAFGRERMVCPLHDYNIGIQWCPPQELPPHTHYQEFNDFCPGNVCHYHEQPAPLHPTDAVIDMPPVFPAPTYSVLDLPSYRGHEHQPHNFDMMGYEDSGVVEQGSSLDDPYSDDQPRVLTPTKEPKFLSETTVIVNRREPAAEIDTVPVPAEQVVVQPVQQAPVVAVAVPAQNTVLEQVTAVPLETKRVTLASPPVRAQLEELPVTPTAFADEDFVRECEHNIARIAESVENMLHSLGTVSFDRPRGRRQQGRRHFDDEYYDDGDDYGDYGESPSHYRKNASKSRPSERRRRRPRDKDGPSLWNWLGQGVSNLRDMAPFPTSNNDAQLIQAANQIRELTQKIADASVEVIAARKAIQQLGLQDQEATQALMTAEDKLWRLIDLETQLANEITRYRLLNTTYDQSCRDGLVEAEEKIRGLIQAETQLAGKIAGYRQCSQQRAGPTVEETPDITTSTISSSSSTSCPTSRT